MSDEQVRERGEELHEDLEHERASAGGLHRWRCSADLRARVLAYAGGCTADGESHTRIAERLGVGQATLSRWIREAQGEASGFRSVAIVPAERRTNARAAAPVSTELRLLTPRGFVVEGLDAELLASLLGVLG